MNLRDREIKRDVLWKLIRQKRSFTVTDLHQETIALMHMTSIKTYIIQLLKAGIIELSEVRHRHVRDNQIGYAPYIEHEYRLVKDTGHMRPQLDKDGKPCLPNGNQKIWIAIKVLKVFDHRDVSFTTSVTTNTVKKYLTIICKAGYLRSIRAGTSHTPETFGFKANMDTGPLAPRLRKNGAVYDPNLKRDVWPLAEVAA